MIITTDCVTGMGAKALHTAQGRPKCYLEKAERMRPNLYLLSQLFFVILG